MIPRVLVAALAGVTMSIGVGAQLPPKPEIPASLGVVQCQAGCASAFQQCIDRRSGPQSPVNLTLLTAPPKQIDISKISPPDDGTSNIEAVKLREAAAESCKPVSAACSARCG